MTVVDAARVESDGDARRLIAFSVAGVTHALHTEDVGEVVPMVLITQLPDAPAWLAGVIDVRGTVIPVIDLRHRLGVAAPPVGLNTPILIAAHRGRRVGLIADAIEQIIEVTPSSIRAADPLMHRSPLVAAVARHASRLIVILDLEAICAGAEELAAA